MAASDDRAQKRLEHLEELRIGILDEMEETDAALSRLRIRVERLESDIRLGADGGDAYPRLKGHEMPATEARLVELYRSLLKIEDKIRALR